MTYFQFHDFVFPKNLSNKAHKSTLGTGFFFIHESLKALVIY